MLDKNGNPLEIRLDPQRYSGDPETYAIAVIVSKHAEIRRKEFQKSEPLIDGFVNKPTPENGPAIKQIDGYTTYSLLTISRSKVFASDRAPWYEWMDKIEAIEPCAKECGMSVAKLAEFIAIQFKPENKQTYLWMADAQLKLIDQNLVKQLADRLGDDSEVVLRRSDVAMKKSAIINKHKAQWPTIESDLNHSDENGLREAAKAPQHGYWYEQASLDWAEARDKRSPNQSASMTNSVFAMKGTVHSLN